MFYGQVKMKNKYFKYTIVIYLNCFVASQLFTQPMATIEPVKDDAAKSVTKRRVDNRKSQWLIQWGYNRDYYTPSDINFRGPGYNFTLHNVTASDKPEKVNSTYVEPSKMAVPQYNLRVSYYITERMNISFGQDHMKYVMHNNQPATIQGYIDPLAIQRAQLNPSQKSLPYLYLFPGHVNQYAGYHNNETINITPDFLQFEHTDGLNYFFLDFGYTMPIIISKNGQHGLSLVSSFGAGPVVLRSDVRLFGEGLNNHFHLSGYALAAYLAFRFDLFSFIYIEAGFKGGYIDLPDILVNGRSKDRASQHMGFLEKIIYIGAPTTF